MSGLPSTERVGFNHAFSPVLGRENVHVDSSGKRGKIISDFKRRHKLQSLAVWWYNGY